MKVSLPTEEQWEWAARAGSGGRHYLDAAAAVKGYNIVDEKDRYRGRAFMRGQWNYGRIQKGHDDGQQWVEKAESFTPNPWGLYNVLGNVSEWTATDYRPLEGVGVTREAAGKIRYKTVRGGSWNDTAAFATLASRWRYTAYQPVYDVGFRVVARR
jgi:formylglycine-generating enzyme required for sulfatase activity